MRTAFLAMVPALILVSMGLAGCQTIANRIPTPGQAICALATAPLRDPRPRQGSTVPTYPAQPEIKQSSTPPLADPPVRAPVMAETKAQPSSSPPIPPQANTAAKPGDSNVQKGLDCMWRDYQQFEYGNALSHLPKVLCHPGASPEQRVTALIIASASYFVLNDQDSARNCLINAIREHVPFVPNAKVFPTAICRMHDDLLQAKKRE